MSNFAFQPERQGYTSLSATLEWFEDHDGGQFEYDTIQDALAGAEICAKTTNRRMLIIQRINATNTNKRGCGWVYPSGTYEEGV